LDCPELPSTWLFNQDSPLHAPISILLTESRRASAQLEDMLKKAARGVLPDEPLLVLAEGAGVKVIPFMSMSRNQRNRRL